MPVAKPAPDVKGDEHLVYQDWMLKVIGHSRHG